VTLDHVGRNQHGDVVATERARRWCARNHELSHGGPAWLFCPADRPERFAKAAAVADVVILDLKRGGADDRAAARKALGTLLLTDDDGVRINAAGTPDYEADLKALASTSYETVMLPKSESAQQIRAMAPLQVIVLIETPLGRSLWRSACEKTTPSAYVGSEDLFAALGGTANRNPDGDVARRRPPRAVGIVVGGEGLFAARAGFCVSRHQGFGRTARGGRRRGCRRLDAKSRSIPVRFR